MYALHATRKLLDRLKQPAASAPPDLPTTRLGNWYATALFWRPQVVLAVNERTRLPVLLRLAPVATVVDRLPDALAAVLAELGIPQALIDDEVAAMRDVSIAKTANRSVLGTINDFTSLAEHAIAQGHGAELLDLALWLAGTPCGPLHTSTGFPNDEARLILTGQPPVRPSAARAWIDGPHQG